ncbi:MAG: PEGA domain-containing protein [Planctomycetes bacterium]|nr:PEGA domain-containing protein [Planctomycetota bacterium]
MAKERGPAQSGSFKLSDSSGAHEVRRKRLSGVFDAASAARALELLQERQLHGSIVISDGLCDVSFFFTRGGLRVLAAGRPLPSLAARLVAQGKLDPAMAPKAGAARRQAKDAKDAGAREERDLLIEVLNLPPAVVDEAAREIVAEVFLDCLFWEQPHHEATSGEPEPEVLQRRDLPAVTVSLGVKDLITQLLARIRTATDLKRNVATMHVVVVPLAKGRDAVQGGGRVGDGPMAQVRTRVLKAVVAEPGQRAAQLVKRLGVGELELATHLHELATQGLVKLDRQPPGKEEELARLRAMEENLDAALSQLVRRMRVAHEAAQAGDQGRAGKHMARAGGLLLREGRDEEAVRTLQNAVQLAPDNLEGREGYVQSLWATNRVAEAVGESEELGRRYLGLNLPARARRILERAVAREEKTTSLELLVRSLVKLRQPKAAAEAGERLLNRLRREGRAAEARDMAAELFELATDADKQRLLRAAGADRRIVVALLALAFVLAGAFVPASRALAARDEYDRAAREAELALRGQRDLGHVRSTLPAVRERFRSLTAHGGEVGDRALAVVAQLERVERDAAALEGLRGRFPWHETDDLEVALEEFQAVRPDTIALARPMRQLIEDVKAFRARGEQTRDQLLRWDPSPEGYAMAARARAEFKSLPALLARMVVRVRVDSSPSGGQVRWDGIDYSSPTPLVLGIPLSGSKELVVTREGYQPLSRQLDFEALGGRHEFTVRLEAARAAEPTRPVRTPPPPPPPPPEPTPEPTSPEPRPSGGVIVTGPQTPEPARERPQIEFRDGGWQGEVDNRFSFEQDASYLAFIEVNARFRATVQAVNRAEGTNVFLVGLRVHVEVMGAAGWRRERPHQVEFGTRYRRPVIAEGGGRYRVQLIARTLHMDEAWLKDQARDAVQAAVRAAIVRERDSRGGR